MCDGWGVAWLVAWIAGMMRDVRPPADVREGTIADALCVEDAIPEFGGAYSRDRYEERLGERRSLILVAEVGGQPAGYKVGYEEDPTTFYSWLGGVVPGFRNSGVASILRQRQESWARSHGYERLRVKSKNQFPHMLRLLIGAGYSIVGTEGSGDGLKIVFETDL